MAQESTVEATIQSVEFDNGWYRVNTDQGEFSTKYQDRGIEAQQFQGQRVLINFQQGDPRQGRNGQWYQSRYLSGITSPGYVAPQLPGAQPGPPQQGGFAQAPSPSMPGPSAMPQQPTLPPRQMGEDENTRNTRIMRQTAGKLAVWTLPLVPSEQRTFENQIAIAEAWMRYFIGGAQGTGLGTPMQPQQADQLVGQVAGVMGAGEGDGIPF
jgi:hypothetical protein